jgi:hypothetical protein
MPSRGAALAFRHVSSLPVSCVRATGGPRTHEIRALAPPGRLLARFRPLRTTYSCFRRGIHGSVSGPGTDPSGSFDRAWCRPLDGVRCGAPTRVSLRGDEGVPGEAGGHVDPGHAELDGRPSHRVHRHGWHAEAHPGRRRAAWGTALLDLRVGDREPTGYQPRIRRWIRARPSSTNRAATIMWRATRWRSPWCGSRAYVMSTSAKR